MKATDKKLWIPLLGGAAIILGSFWLVFRDQDISDNISDWSYFGAYVGGCFSIVSVILIYLTFREQSKIAYQTRFESVFFDMLRTLRELKTKEISGAFSDLQGKITLHFNSSFTPEDINIKEGKETIAYYFQLHNEYDEIHHYFRFLYHVIMYVCKDNVLDYNEKERYIALIQAQMSNEELLIVLFNVVNYGNTKYLETLDTYHFFENIRSINELLDYIIIKLFPQTTFKHLINPNSECDVIYDFELDSLLHEKELYFDTIDRLKKLSRPFARYPLSLPRSEPCHNRNFQ